jgi:Fe-S-cluster containining protein
LGTPLRIDPGQRFTCSQCGRCCHRFDVVVSEAEVETYRRRGAAQWFRDGGDAVGSADPFEPIPELPGTLRIRKRADGACGFLSADQRCRIHEELGGDQKPLTCRLFPFSFHPAADGVIVTASFACPTIIANQGTPLTSTQARADLEALRVEWFKETQLPALPLEFVKGRSMDTRTARILRENLATILAREGDIRDNIAGVAAVLEDLTRPRVLALPDADFAEYVALTLPFAAAKTDAPPPQSASRIEGLLQRGFVFLVAATRAMVERRGHSHLEKRIAVARLLAHFHGIAPGVDRVNVKALKRRSIDINAPEIRPIVFHYLRSSIETLGARRRPLLDEIAIACAYLNAACALAIMNADHAGAAVDRHTFTEALMETSDLAHAATGQLFDWAVRQLAGGTGPLRQLALSGRRAIG